MINNHDMDYYGNAKTAACEIKCLRKIMCRHQIFDDEHFASPMIMHAYLNSIKVGDPKIRQYADTFL